MRYIISRSNNTRLGVPHRNTVPSPAQHINVIVAIAHGKGDLVWTGGTSPADMAADLAKQLGS